jgi:hypothetical protein
MGERKSLFRKTDWVERGFQIVAGLNNLFALVILFIIRMAIRFHVIVLMIIASLGMWYVRRYFRGCDSITQ